MNSQSQSGRGDSTCRFYRVPVVLLGLLAAVSFGSGCVEMKQYSVDSWQGPLPMQDLRYVDVDPWTPIPPSEAQRAAAETPIVPVVTPIVPAETPIVPAGTVPAGTPVIPVETPVVPAETPIVPDPTNRVTP